METNQVSSILEKWSNKYKRSINCSNPKGFSQKAHCAGRRKRKRGGKTKSRPVESFVQEIMMSDLKKFIVNEIASNLEKELAKKKIKESSKTLYEAVTLSQTIKKSGDENKIKMAESAVKLAEKKLVEDYDEYDGDCNCGEGEGQMLKAQLLSIMSNAQKLFHMIDDNDQFEDWIQSKITIAEDYLRASYSYLTYYNGNGEAEDSDWDDNDTDWDDYDNMEPEGDWDDIEQEDWQEGEIDNGDSGYGEALDADIDDDVFENKKR